MKSYTKVWILLLLASALAWAATPPALINYQGVLRNTTTGDPIPGPVSIVFAFYTVDTGGTALWEETQSVPVNSGLFTVALGDPAHKTGGAAASLAELFTGNASVYLGVDVEENGEMTPRVRVLASAYAQNASSLQGAVNVSPAGNVGIGTTAPVAKLTVSGGSVDAEQLTANTQAPATVSWQSFTPGTTGHLVTISFDAVAAYGSPRTLEVRSGEGIGGALLHSQTVDLVNGLTDYNLTIPVPVAAGSKYTWSVSGGTNSLWRSTTNTYAGGLCSLNAGHDLVFRTYIAPEKTLVVVGGTHLQGALLDQSGSAGTAGRILQTTGSGTDWVDPSSIADGDWTITGSDMVSNVSGNVGIGAAVPAAKLHVSAAAPEVRVENTNYSVGQSAAVTFMHSARYAAIQSYLPGSNDVDLRFTTTNGSTPATAMVLTGDGNLGIGTISPGGRLVVSEDTCFQDQINTTYTASSLTWGFWQSFRPAAGGYLCKVKLGYGTAFGEVDTFTLEVRTGVGTGGTLLYSKSGLITQQWGYDTQATLDAPLWLAAEQDYTLVVAHSGTNMGHVHVDESNPYARGQSSVSGADIEFTTFMNYNSGGEPTLIAGSGLVGIGTASPVNWLDVGGSAAIGAGYAGTSMAPANGLIVEGNAGLGTTNPVNRLDVEGATAIGAAYAGTSAGPANGLIVEGRVGIGTASPAALPLTVQGSGTASQLIQFKDSAGANQWHLNLQGSGLNLSESGVADYRLFVEEGGSVGIGTGTPGYQLQLSTDSAAKLSTMTWTVWSDARLKRDIRPYTDGLDMLARVHPVRYRLNGLAGLPAGHEGIGVIAQEIMAIAPYTVGISRARLHPADAAETEIYDFNGSALVFALINAVQELDERTKGLADKDAKAAIARELDDGARPLAAKEGLSGAEDTPEVQAGPLSPAGSAAILEVSPQVEAGEVLVIVPDNGADLHPCYAPADPMVVGISLADAVDGRAPVATSGIAIVKADATLAPIAKGDLLTTSATPGHAMKAQPKIIDGEPICRNGTILGKALESLDTGTGMIRVLVMLR